ncbi:ArnT family glycosyltransferase [Streptomyces sp. NPDC015127]|uniref:ArnT family glycosyltransferase n=1 Tax=Streptomyces sp. NPDC015127 TaxID=3364939 RepID=UPI0036F8543F
MRQSGVINEARAGAAGGAWQGPPGGTAHGNPLRWLAAVCAAFALVHLVLVAPGLGLGWDESVYVSQVSPQAPAAFFSAPRARGITFLVAPVTSLTTSVVALRVFMAVLAGCGLFVALWVWRRLLPAPVLGVAGALFAGLWITMFYASQAMPNLWVAYGALAAVGCFLRAARDPDDRWAPAGMAAGVAFAALMRPTDAMWFALPLAVAAVVMRAWRWPLLLAALVAGVAVGCAPWIAEAYAAYGGLSARLERASEIQGRLGWYFSVDDHVRALDGRLLCRPCDVPWRHPAAALWFFALPLFVAAGVRAAVRDRRHRAEMVVATVVGAALAAPYLFTVGYAAPRFLLPAYALLALPVAYGLVRLCRPRPRGRRIVVGLVAAAVAAHLAVQYRVVDSAADRVRRSTADLGRITAELHALGVRPPCVVSGAEAIRIAFRAGCSSRQPRGHDGSITPEELAATARHRPVAVVVAEGGRPPAYARAWPSHPLPDLGSRTGLRAYVAGARPAAPGATPSEPPSTGR